MLWSCCYHRRMENERVVELERMVLGERARGDFWKAAYQAENLGIGDELSADQDRLLKEAICRQRVAKEACERFGVKP